MNADAVLILSLKALLSAAVGVVTYGAVRRVTRGNRGELYPEPPGWLGREASRQMALLVAVTMWAVSSAVLVYLFARLFGGLYGQVDLELYLFLAYLLPVGLGLVVAKEGSSPFHRDLMALPAPGGPPKRGREVPADAKSYAGEELTESGFPSDLKKYIRPRSSAELQGDYLSRRESKSLSRFEKWRRAQFSFYNVFGV